MIWILYFVVGIAVLLLSTRVLVKSSEEISKAARLSPLIIGSTIVALGTSLPELTVSLIAVIRNDSGLALGNIIGSNIVNVLMILPVGLMIGKIRIGTTKTQRNAIFLLGATILFMVLNRSDVPRTMAGVLLILSAVIFTITELVLGVEGRSREDAKTFKGKLSEHFNLGRLILMLLAVLGILFGGLMTVESIEEISLITGVSTTVLGLTLTAMATSLPELLTTIFTQEEHQEKITIGNIIGSNIYNLLFIGGLLSFFPDGGGVSFYEWVWLAGVTLFFVYILKRFSGQVIPNQVKWLLGSILIVYLFSLVYLPG